MVAIAGLQIIIIIKDISNFFYIYNILSKMVSIYLVTQPDQVQAFIRSSGLHGLD